MEEGECLIKQRSVTIKTASASLNYSEIGDVVVNSAVAVTLTLPVPNVGLWYLISNVGTGVVTLFYGSAMTTLNQTENALLLANGTSGWFLSKGSMYTLTKEAVEEVLTGVITSHGHEISLPFVNLTDVPVSYNGQTGKLLAVNASETGLVFVSAPAAENGLPAGGTAGQVLVKNSTNDFDADWVDASSSGGSTLETIWGEM